MREPMRVAKPEGMHPSGVAGVPQHARGVRSASLSWKAASRGLFVRGDRPIQ
jgi:hypothetical protein